MAIHTKTSDWCIIMENDEYTPKAHSDKGEFIYDVLHYLDTFFSTRHLTFLSDIRNQMMMAVNGIISLDNKKPLVVPFYPGTGKSRLRDGFLITLCKHIKKGTSVGNRLGGCIVVVEKIAEEQEIQALLQDECGYFDIDNKIPWGHVMQSLDGRSIKKGLCKTPYVKSNAECLRSNCPECSSCKILNSIKDIEQSPILIMTHARYKMFQEDMTDFMTYSHDNHEYRRTVLLIDEEPDLYNIDKIDSQIIHSLEDQIESSRYSNSLFNERCKLGVLSKLRSCIRYPFEKIRKELFSSSYCNVVNDRDDGEESGSSEKVSFPLYGFCSPAQNLYLADAPDAVKYISNYFGKNSNTPEELTQIQSVISGSGMFCRSDRFSLCNPKVADIAGEEQPRTVILSGTAQFSPVLNGPNFEVLSFETSETYEHLEIHVLYTDLFKSNKSAMKTFKNRYAVLELAKDWLSDVPKSKKVLVVTYKEHADEFYQNLSEYHDRIIPMLPDDEDAVSPSKVVYFGGVNGSNRYMEATYVFCLGLGRYNEETYVLRSLACDWDGRAKDVIERYYSENAEEREEFEDQNILDLPVIHDYMITSQANDLVQMIFRCALRNHHKKTPVKVYLLQPPKEVVEILTDVFKGCSIIPESLSARFVLQTESRKTRRGKPTKPATLAKYFLSWDEHPVKKAEIMKELSFTKQDFKDALGSSVISEFMKNYVKVSKEGRETVYSKKPNSIWDDVA